MTTQWTERMINLPELDLKCAFCDSTFGSFGAVIRHENVCPFKHWHPKDYEYYVNRPPSDVVAVKTRPYPCHMCAEVFDTYAKLLSHKNYDHLKPGYYGCSRCSDIFKSTTERDRHFWKNHFY